MGKAKWIAAVVVIILIGIIVFPRLPEIFLALGIEGAGPTQSLQPGTESKNPEKPGSWIEDVRFTGINRDGVTGYIEISIKNPNPYSATLDRFSYELYDTDMNKIAEGETPYQISIPADTTVTHKIDFQTDWLGSVSGIEDLINPFKNAEWTVEGEIYVDIGPSTFTIPFTEKVKP